MSQALKPASKGGREWREAAGVLMKYFVSLARGQEIIGP